MLIITSPTTYNIGQCNQIVSSKEGLKIYQTIQLIWIPHLMKSLLGHFSTAITFLMVCVNMTSRYLSLTTNNQLKGLLSLNASVKLTKHDTSGMVVCLQWF